MEETHRLGQTQNRAEVSSKYWDKAYDNIDDDMKKRLERLRSRFDEDTKNAITKLGKKRSDDATKSSLHQIGNGNYHKLTIKEKGELQRLASTTEKKLNQETIEAIARIKHDHQNRLHPEGSSEIVTGPSHLDEVLEMCQERKNLADKGHFMFKFLGQERTLGEVWNKVINGINNFKSTVNIATSTNGTAGLVWGIIKVFLEFALQGEKASNEALAGISKAINTIDRASVYEIQIQEIFERQESDDHPHLGAFESCLISTYERILKFFYAAATCLERSKPGLYWYAFWSGEDILIFEQDIFKYEQKLFQDATTSFLSTQGRIAKQIRDLLLEHGSSLSTVQEGIRRQHNQLETERNDEKAMQSYIASLLSIIDSRIEENQRLMHDNFFGVKREDILAWISTTKVEDHHNDVKGRRTPNTAEWILERVQYRYWSEANGASLLWIKGIPGAGKTVLVSRIIEECFNSSKEGSSIVDCQLAYFYCKRDDAERRFGEDILRSFIRQLASAYHPLPDKTRRIYENKNHKSSLSSRLNLEECWDLLKEFIRPGIQTVLILDALDECIGDEECTNSSNETIEPKSEMLKVMEAFNRVLELNGRIKILVSSRYDSQIQNDLVRQHMVEISPEDNRSDIERMVEKRIDNYNQVIEDRNKRNSDKKRRQPLIDTELKGDILRVFNEKGQGMFQWASLHIQNLLRGLREKTLRGSSALKSELGKLPKGLIKTYHDFFKRIDSLEESQRNTAYRAFKWLLAFKGSCDKDVLFAATFYKREGEPDEVEGDEEFVLVACQNLIITEGSVFRFSHLSIQEYCEEHRPELKSQCHFDVAMVCALVLFRYNTAEISLTPWVNRYLPGRYRGGQSSEIRRLWDFANRHWHEQFEQIPEESHRDEIRGIINSSPQTIFNAWICAQVADLVAHFPTQTAYLGDELPFLKPQFWAKPRARSSFYLRDDFSSIISTSIFSGIIYKISKSMKKGLTRDTASGVSGWDCVAARDWFLSVTSYEYRAQSYFRNFSRNSGNQFEKMLGILDPGDKFCLCKEVWMLCRMLIAFETEKAHPTLDSVHKLFESLEETFEKSYTMQFCEEIAKLLMLFNCLQEIYLALIDGEPRGEDLSGYLLKRFPDALQIQYTHLVPLFQDYDWSCELLRASRFMDPQHLNILLSHGACLNPQNSDTTPLKETPLIEAILGEKVENVRVLLENGADTNLNCPGGKYGNALIAVCSMENPQLLDLLVEREGNNFDTEVSYTKGDCSTALIAACRSGNVNAVKKLLGYGVVADKTVSKGMYKNALFAAADGQSVRVVRLLCPLSKKFPRATHKTWRWDGYQYFDFYHSDTIEANSHALAQWFILRFIRGVDQIDEFHKTKYWGSSENVSEDRYQEEEEDEDEEEENPSQEREDDMTDEEIAKGILRLIEKLAQDILGVDSLLVGHELVQAFGFATSWNKHSIAKGFEKRLILDQRMGLDEAKAVVRGWAEFLDMAEKSANVDEFNASVIEEIHSGGPLKRSKRVDSDFEIGPYSEEDEDFDNTEDEVEVEDGDEN